MNNSSKSVQSIDIQIDINNIPLVLSFFLFLPFLVGNLTIYTPSQGKKVEKSTLNVIFLEEICQLWREINTFQPTSSFTNHVFSIFWKKM